MPEAAEPVSRFSAYRNGVARNNGAPRSLNAPRGRRSETSIVNDSKRLYTI
jgi:hypothetical protein